MRRLRPKPIRTRVHVGRYERHSPRGRVHTVDPHTRRGRGRGKKRRRFKAGTHYTIRDEYGQWGGSLIT